MKLNGTELVGRTVRDILDEGVGFVPEDRSVDGLVKEFSVAENMMLDRSHGEPFVKAGTLQLGALSEFAKGKICLLYTSRCV